MTIEDLTRAAALNSLAGYRDRITSRQHRQDRDLEQRARDIRRAYEAGAGLSEIATAAGISRQRVHQIIQKGLDQ